MSTTLYLQFLGSYNICIIYLHVTEACLKVTSTMLYFCYLQNSSIVMKIVFNSFSIYSWTKIFLSINIRRKCLVRKTNLFFLTPWKMSIFPSEISHFEHDHRFLSTREMRSIRSCKEIRLGKRFKYRLLTVRHTNTSILTYSFQNFIYICWHCFS